MTGARQMALDGLIDSGDSIAMWAAEEWDDAGGGVGGLGRQSRMMVSIANMDEEAANTALGKKRRRCVVYPNSRIRRIVDLVVTLGLIYTLLAVPFRFGFNVPAEGVSLAVEVAVDLIFVIDVVLNCRTAFFAKGTLVTGGRAIMGRYLQTWLLIDLVAAFPIDLVVAVAIPPDERNIVRMAKVVALVRVLRWFRFKRLSKGFRRWEIHASLNSAIFQIVKLAVVVLWCTHVLACGFYAVAIMEGEEASWLAAVDVRGGTLFDRYVLSYYWAITTVTTIGYGDIAPVTSTERCYIVLATIVGVTLFSYSVGVMSQLVLRVERNPTREKLDQVNTYLRFRKVPKDLQVAIREHYLFAWRRKNIATLEEQILRTELSKELKTRLATFLKEETLKNSPLFNGLDLASIVDILQSLKPQAAAPGDDIITEGEIGRALYILNRGSVDVISADGTTKYATLTDGAIFGEMVFFSDDQRRKATVRAVTHCELEVLRRDDFLAVLADRNITLENTELHTLSAARERALSTMHRASVSSVAGDRPPLSPPVAAASVRSGAAIFGGLASRSGSRSRSGSGESGSDVGMVGMRGGLRDTLRHLMVAPSVLLPGAVFATNGAGPIANFGINPSALLATTARARVGVGGNDEDSGDLGLRPSRSVASMLRSGDSLAAAGLRRVFVRLAMADRSDDDMPAVTRMVLIEDGTSRAQLRRLAASKLVVEVGSVVGLALVHQRVAGLAPAESVRVPIDDDGDVYALVSGDILEVAVINGGACLV